MGFPPKDPMKRPASSPAAPPTSVSYRAAPDDPAKATRHLAEGL